VESNPVRRNVSFQLLQSRLIQLVNLRIKNGDFTERGLARLLGISQSQVHNVLKGARRLQPELADHIMYSLGVTVLDLLKLD
jgi:plasmid maintenance system antidote protein VapI